MRVFLVSSLSMLALVGALAACGRFGYELIELPAVGGRSGGLSGAWSVLQSDGTEAPDMASAGMGSGGVRSSDASNGATPSESGGASPSGDLGSADAATDASPEPQAATGIIDIADPSQTVRSGVAAIVQGQLRLTNDTQGDTGAVFLPTQYPISGATSFAVSFSFHISATSAQRGDGFAFLWQDDLRGSKALGAPGGNIGYDGITPPAITPSVIVEFDNHQNAFDAHANQVAITSNGASQTAISEAAAPFPIDDGVTHYAWIDYAAATTTLSVRTSATAQRPVDALVTANIDLFATVGSSAYIGFTAACGNSSETSAIESWTVDYR